MASGLAALLDDIAAIAKAAAASVDDVATLAGKATVKAAGVVVDDAAVAPRFVDGVTPARELPIIGKITLGSLRNKLLIILPAILLLNHFLPWALTPLLMLGGAYLCFEGAEKLWELLFKRGHHDAVGAAEQDEKTLVRGAIRTDFILSAEIMVISLNEVAAERFWQQLATLVVVALGVTLGVYGVVALIVKTDDVGLRFASQPQPAMQKLGRLLVHAMPVVLQVISTVGIFAMLWVGGHIMLSGANTLGWHAPYELVHHLSHVTAVPVLMWLIETFLSLVVGVIVGSILMPVGKLLHKKH
ncbi:DUF808 domain-containing protein [Canibacter oris]|uniref:DUF808 domain-containing protein n=1 Tax=Canibacter oris TaxID=1365628 RepID=A0A840DNY8_9MICO|nr:DUF808 domain-containing protein [Canibacter oris]MBB4071748.1 hypothetical protein [Canibacter oris]